MVGSRSPGPFSPARPHVPSTDWKSKPQAPLIAKHYQCVTGVKTPEASAKLTWQRHVERNAARCGWITVASSKIYWRRKRSPVSRS